MSNHCAEKSPLAPKDDGSFNRRKLLLAGTTLAAASVLQSVLSSRPAQAQQAGAGGKKPNILVIFGDDIGVPQISAYTMGMMGYRMPNIDRIASEGAIFTDAYGQQSCTAGRASFILGQEPFRTGLLTIGMPAIRTASPSGCRPSPTC
jgi:arylsulfatase